MCSATGAVGHVLAEKKRDVNIYGKSVAALADQVLPALSASMHLLRQQDPAEATNFATTVAVAIDAAAQSGPATAEMTRKITAALAA
ncbi:hypothetical protein ACIRRA_31390 [Nocardia sp. NPDC101769]|uniref:hypothetical protein n=1 Tax=Nocardia sp. NPDC101769 TaxID=3364333 RepID=UPI00380EFF9C